MISLSQYRLCQHYPRAHTPPGKQGSAATHAHSPHLPMTCPLHTPYPHPADGTLAKDWGKCSLEASTAQGAQALCQLAHWVPATSPRQVLCLLLSHQKDLFQCFHKLQAKSWGGLIISSSLALSPWITVLSNSKNDYFLLVCSSEFSRTCNSV